MTFINRSRRARKSAGLSLGQAARKLGVTIDHLRRVEQNDAAYVDADPARLAELYGVNLDWLGGRSELCDYAAVKKVRGADELPFRDRDMLAELFASLPRRSLPS